MKIAFDTSVIVPALTPALPAHPAAYARLQAAFDGRIEGVMSLHGFAEAWAVLTRLPIRPPPNPAAARDALGSLQRAIRGLPLDDATYEAAVARCVERALRSGAVFDALHVICAERAGAAAIVTANLGDFERLVGDSGLRVVSCDTSPDSVLRRRRS